MKKWIKVIITVLFFVPINALSKTTDCKTHKLYCKILKFNPKIDKSFAMELSNKIYYKAKANNIDPNISLAILLQESSLNNINTFKTHKTVNRYCEGKKCFKVIQEVNEVVDMTIAQININTAHQYDFDVERLFDRDLDYALDCHYIILKDKMKMCKHLGDLSWSCYHSATEHYRLIYVDMVNRFLQ